jgi:hypothetical protein
MLALERESVIAFLKSAAEAPKDDQTAQMQGGMGPMQGMQQVPKLETVDGSSRVKSITYCRDTFTVTTEDVKSHDFWEGNLGFKTDSSDEGPDKNAPTILAASMMVTVHLLYSHHPTKSASPSRCPVKRYVRFGSKTASPSRSLVSFRRLRT